MSHPIPSLANPTVRVVDEEYALLADIVCSSPRATRGLALLWQELERATCVNVALAPSDLVRLGSAVHYTDLTRREGRRVRLVTPGAAQSPTFVSVASTLGASLLGLRKGDVFRWEDAVGNLRALRVDHVEPPLKPRVVPRRGCVRGSA